MTRPSRFALAVIAAVVIVVGGAAAAASSVLLDGFPPRVATAADLVGRWGSAAPGEPFLELAADGAMGGHDGCNGFGGSWRVDAGTGAAVFDDVYMSLVACPGGDQWLSGAAAAQLHRGLHSGLHSGLHGDRLIVIGHDGSALGSLRRP